MRKVVVYFPAFAGVSVELEVADDTPTEDIIEQARYEARLSECTAYDWDYDSELEIEEL